MSTTSQFSKNFITFLKTLPRDSVFLKDRQTLVRAINRFLKLNKKYKLRHVVTKIFRDEKHRIYLFPTNDLINFLIRVIRSYGAKTVLELFAGRGYLAKILSSQLTEYGISYIATDSMQYDYKTLIYPVKKITANTSLAKFAKLQPFVLIFLPASPRDTLPEVFRRIKKYKLTLILCIYNGAIEFLRRSATQEKLKMRRISIPTFVFGDVQDSITWKIGNEITPPNTSLFIIK